MNMYKEELQQSISETLEKVKDKGYEEGRKSVMRDIYWFMQNYKNDSGLRIRLEMYLSENDYN